MPGCGKSTAGKVLSERLERSFIDTDEIIVRNSKMPIPEIFSLYGEDEIRKREHDAAKEAGKVSGAVIATGGGIVTREENRYPLKQNSFIVWLKRDISRLPLDGRPISQQNNLVDLYNKRAPLYQSFADITVEVSEDPEETVDRIIEEIRRM